MSQKNKHSSHNAELYGSKTATYRDRQKTRPSTPKTCIHKFDERYHMEKVDQSNQYLLKNSSLNKQQNVPSSRSSPQPQVVQYSASDDSALVEVTVRKTSNPPKQRSKSTVSDRKPWGQMLKENKTSSKESVFSNFDPLRTLHFLAKELQIHVEALLPDELNVQEIITAMQSALKRVPPEVASLVHLQQSIGLLPAVKSNSSQRSNDNEIPEKPYLITEHKGVQTFEPYSAEEVNKIRKLMEDSTLKLEESCKNLETLCTQLKNEKIYLEGQLQSERSNAEFLKKRIEDLENVNKNISQTLYKKDEEVAQLNTKIESLEAKIEETYSSKNEIKSIIGDLKKSKLNLEQDCVKLKHQLRLCAIEKEKYLAVLGVRDRQIQEIRNEMSQLQEVVNDQLVELHNNALASIPSSASASAAQLAQKNKEITENCITSTIHNDDDDETYNINYKFSDNDLASGDEATHPTTQNMYVQDNVKHFVSRDSKKVADNDNPESQTTAKIRDMFFELKKQAFALTGPNSSA